MSDTLYFLDTSSSIWSFHLLNFIAFHFVIFVLVVSALKGSSSKTYDHVIMRTKNNMATKSCTKTKTKNPFFIQLKTYLYGPLLDMHHVYIIAGWLSNCRAASTDALENETITKTTTKCLSIRRIQQDCRVYLVQPQVEFLFRPCMNKCMPNQTIEAKPLPNYDRSQVFIRLFITVFWIHK